MDVQVAVRAVDAEAVLAHRREMRAARDEMHVLAGRREPPAEIPPDPAGAHDCEFHGRGLAFRLRRAFFFPSCPRSTQASMRSEEHTSELQSLMRISYAVFCLK